MIVVLDKQFKPDVYTILINKLCVLHWLGIISMQSEKLVKMFKSVPLHKNLNSSLIV